MRQSLHDAWWRLATTDRSHSLSDAVILAALSAGSGLYGGVVGLRNAAYDRRWLKAARLPCRVVSVGNLTVGGTGKTACVELIARKLKTLGKRVAVLSRGYGGAKRSYTLLSEAGEVAAADGDGLSLRQAADEPQLLASHLDGVPIVVGADRASTGRLACERFNTDCLVLDDGFQHRRLARDCDIVLVHARMPFGGWPLLPRGPMREPMASLSRAHVIVITKSDEAWATNAALIERLRSLNPEATMVTAVHQPVELVEATTGAIRGVKHVSGLRVGLLSSIGDPHGFEATVQRLEAQVCWHLPFPDHHPYAAGDLKAVAARTRSGRPHAIVTTEKDWVRLRPLAAAWPSVGVPLWVLRVEMQLVNGHDELDHRLARLWAD